MEEVKLVEHDRKQLRLAGRLPRCFFCGGDMLPVVDRQRPTWRCEDCGAVIRQGYSQPIVNNIVKGDLYNIEKARRQSHSGGRKSGRKRKKNLRKRKMYDYPNSDAG